jgi:hypothetical protein
VLELLRRELPVIVLEALGLAILGYKLHCKSSWDRLTGAYFSPDFDFLQ